jgi:RNA polymerase sigma factor (sigma-70 family)
MTMGQFPTTSWSMVLAAGADPSALSALCEAYWRPVHEYIVKQGTATDDALDLTQEFFSRLIEKNYSAQAERERGRFRCFLLAAVKHFLLDAAKKGRTQKRGGGRALLSLDFETDQSSYRLEPRDDLTPDKIFTRRWAFTVMNRALLRLRSENHFAQLEPFLTGEGSGIPYSRLAADLGVSEGVVKTRVHRMRKKFGGLLRAEIALTVESADQIEEELRYLLAAI